LLSVFWFYLQNETLEYLFNKINTIPNNSEKTIIRYEVKNETNQYLYNQDMIIKLLSNFFILENHMKDAIDLSFEYIKKIPSKLPELIDTINKNLIFDIEDECFGFERQSILFKSLITGMDNHDELYAIAFFELSKTFLMFTHHHTEGVRKRTITYYDYPLPNNIYIRNFRKNIWENMLKYFSDIVFEVLRFYIQGNYKIVKEIMEYDMEFIITIIENHLLPNSFEHCKYVQEQIRFWKRNDIISPFINSLQINFTNYIYEMYLKISMNRLGVKEDHEYVNYSEFRKLKEIEIKNEFVFNDKVEVENFYRDFLYLAALEDEGNQYNYNDALDIIVSENSYHNVELGFLLLQKIINNNIIGYVPRVFFQNYLVSSEKVMNVWNFMQNNEFEYKQLWELSFYDNISDTLIDKKYITAIKDTFMNIDSFCTISFDRLQRFLVIEPKLFVDLLEIISHKNENIGKIYIWDKLFSQYFDNLGEDLSLIKKVYLQQILLHKTFDHKKKGLLNILFKDSYFLIEYVESLYKKNSARHYINDDYKLGIVWQIENMESVLNDLFNLLSEKEHYIGILKHFCNSFFWNLEPDKKDRAKIFLIEYSKRNFTDYNKINIVVDVARHSMREVYNEILLNFLSKTQDIEIFSNIYWRGCGTSGHGDILLGDIEASEWRNILSIVEKSDVGIKLIPIKQYINLKIEYSLEYAMLERKRRFLEHW